MVVTDSTIVQTYHDATKHSEISVRTSGHYLDWKNKPSPFKMYRNLPSIPLPRDFPHPQEAALKAIRGETPRKTVEKPNLAVLAEILYFSGGLTRKMKFGNEPYYMRAASATGALYPIELYLVSGDIPELKEASVGLAVVGAGLGPRAQAEHREIPMLHLNVEPLSKEEVDYPIIWDAHKAGELTSQREVEKWREGFKPRLERLIPVGPMIPLQPLKEESSTPLAEVILRRGSSRRFAQQPISFEALSTVLQASSVPVSFDLLPEDESLIEFYFIANDVDGLPSGSYYYDQETESLEQLKLGKFRSISGYLSLGQPLFSQVSVIVFLQTDLIPVTECFINCGYRTAQYDAGSVPT